MLRNPDTAPASAPPRQCSPALHICSRREVLCSPSASLACLDQQAIPALRHSSFHKLAPCRLRHWHKNHHAPDKAHAPSRKRPQLLLGSSGVLAGLVQSHKNCATALLRSSQTDTTPNDTCRQKVPRCSNGSPPPRARTLVLSRASTGSPAYSGLHQTAPLHFPTLAKLSPYQRRGARSIQALRQRLRHQQGLAEEPSSAPTGAVACQGQPQENCPSTLPLAPPKPTPCPRRHWHKIAMPLTWLRHAEVHLVAEQLSWAPPMQPLRQC